jgi:repressor LexA
MMERQLGLTPKMRALKHFIASRIEATGCAPSFDEMMPAIGQKSKSGVHRLVLALVERGHLERLPGRARALRIAGQPTIDTADALRIVAARCKMSRETADEIARLLAAEVSA